GVDHLPPLLRARRGVEERARLPVELLLEDREVGAQLVRVEARLGAHGHRPIVPTGFRTPASARVPARSCRGAGLRPRSPRARAPPAAPAAGARTTGTPGASAPGRGSCLERRDARPGAPADG